MAGGGFQQAFNFPFHVIGFGAEENLGGVDVDLEQDRALEPVGRQLDRTPGRDVVSAQVGQASDAVELLVEALAAVIVDGAGGEQLGQAAVVLVDELGVHLGA